MPHIHEKIDYAVAVFVVRHERVLLVHHRQLDMWLPVGGHVELDEDPEQAALREVREESGLEVELIGERPPVSFPGTRALIAPRFMDIHQISQTHQHIGLMYLARVVRGDIRCATAEHHAIRWCSAKELESLTPPLNEAVRWYCLHAIQEVTASEEERAPLGPIL